MAGVFITVFALRPSLAGLLYVCVDNKRTIWKVKNQAPMLTLSLLLVFPFYGCVFLP